MSFPSDEFWGRILLRYFAWPASRSAMQGNESFNLHRYYLAESSASFSADKLCSFLRGRNHGDLSRYPRSYYYLRANILRHFSPLRKTLPRGILYISKCNVEIVIIKIQSIIKHVQIYCTFNIKNILFCIFFVLLFKL